MDSSPDINPYAAPMLEPEPVLVTHLTWRARIACLLLLLHIPFDVASGVIVFAWGPSALISKPVGALAAHAQAVSLYHKISIYLIAATALSFCVWLHGAVARAGSVVRDARYTPRWSVLCWFVPIVNFWEPFLVLRHLWELSHGGREWRKSPPPSYITAWWVCWLAPLVIAIPLAIATALKMPIADNPWVRMPSYVVSIVGAWLSVRMVREITSLQYARLGPD